MDSDIVDNLIKTNKTIQMKNIILVIGIILLSSLSSFSQYKTYNNCIVEFENYVNIPENLIYENDSIKFEFKPNTDSSWPVIITNKTNTTCSVNWENGVFERGDKSGRIIFIEDSRITKDREKQPSKILSRSSLKKDLFPDVCVLSNIVAPIYYKSELRKKGAEHLRLLLPISFNGIEKQYMFKFKIYVPEKNKVNH